jgi:hypothetical protein
MPLTIENPIPDWKYRLMQLMRFMPLPENADKTENVKHEKNKEA